MAKWKIPRATTAERLGITPDSGELIYDETLEIVYYGDGATVGGLPFTGSEYSEAFETVSKNIKSWDYSLNYTSGDLTSIVYTDGVDTITKTLNYTSGDLTSIVLSGDTPAGINLTKTLTYASGDLTAVTYS